MNLNARCGLCGENLERYAFNIGVCTVCGAPIRTEEAAPSTPENNAGPCWMCGTLAKALANLLAEVAKERTERLVSERLVSVPLKLSMAEDDARDAVAAWRRGSEGEETNG